MLIEPAPYSIRHFNPRSPRGERRFGLPHQRGTRNFNPRSPRGERPGVFTGNWSQAWISIHAPRVGSDGPGRTCSFPHCNFNPRSPRGERRVVQQETRKAGNFNPRSPRGERLRIERQAKLRVEFQSTLPAWGATCHEIHQRGTARISIHAPRVGSDGIDFPSVHFPIISIHAPRVGSDPIGKTS